MTGPSARIERLDAAPDLVGPPAGVREGIAGVSNEPGWVTGLGLVARIDPALGLESVWLGRDRIAGAVQVTLDGEPATPTDGFSWANGGWAGERATRSGHAVREIGLLPDAASVCLLQWEVDAPPPGVGTLEVRLEGAAGEAVSLPLGPTGRSLAVLYTDDRRTARGRYTPVGARERRRRSRHRAGGTPPTTFRLDERPVPDLDAAICRIEESPLGDPSRPGVSLFLDEFTEAPPRFVAARSLGALGEAALLIGRHGVARGCIHSLSGRPGEAPETLLDLVSSFFEWTGDGALVASIEPGLREALAQAVAAHAGTVSAESLSRFVSAVEPLGLSGLRAAAEARLALVGDTTLRGRALPTVERGAGDPDVSRTDATGPDGPGDPSTHPSRAPGAASSSYAARLVRSWLAAHLELRPEAAYGRVVLSPRFSEEWRTLTVSDLPVGDGGIGIVLGRESHDFEMRAIQTGGRVPLNLACEPWFPATGLLGVRIDGEPARVQASEDGNGTRVRFQLPLDAERRISFSFTEP